MADHNLVIPISTDKVFKADDRSPVRGGGRRFVPAVPIGNDGSTAPCIWRSHVTIQVEEASGSHVPGCECLLLISSDPPTVVRAEVALSAWQHFGETIVEW